jgi:hypothetical protein
MLASNSRAVAQGAGKPNILFIIGWMQPNFEGSRSLYDERSRTQLRRLYLLFGCTGGAGTGRDPPGAGAPRSRALYHGLERHSASVPDAAA